MTFADLTVLSRIVVEDKKKTILDVSLSVLVVMITLYIVLHRFKELQTFSRLKAFAKEIPLFSCLCNAKSVASSQSALLLCLQPERERNTEHNEHPQLTVQISPNYGHPCVPCYILTCLPCECTCQVSETARFRHVTTKRCGCSGLF